LSYTRCCLWFQIIVEFNCFDNYYLAHFTLHRTVSNTTISATL